MRKKVLKSNRNIVDLCIVCPSRHTSKSLLSYAGIGTLFKWTDGNLNIWKILRKKYVGIVLEHIKFIEHIIFT